MTSTFLVLCQVIGSVAAKFKRPLFSVDMSMYVSLSVCLSVHNFDAKYLRNYTI